MQDLTNETFFSLPNTKQIVPLPVAAVIASVTPDVIRDDIQMVLSNYQGDELKTKLDEIAERLPPKMKEELSRYGCKLPIENVKFYMTVGSYLYDVYCANLPAKESPIQRQLQETRKSRLAEMCMQEEISLPTWAEDHIIKNLADEKSYPETVFHLLFEVDGQERSTAVNSKALLHFAAIEKSVAAYFVSKMPIDG